MLKNNWGIDKIVNQIKKYPSFFKNRKYRFIPTPNYLKSGFVFSDPQQKVWEPIGRQHAL